jgi:hypothetical protein
VFASALILPIAFGQTTLTTAQIAKRVSPSVVVIQGKTNSGEIQGSGFIVSNDGKIVTNLHVIRDLNTAKVQLAGGEVFTSLSVLALDERRDLAIVKVGGSNLTVLPLGNSDALAVGERVVVVGSPLGLDATVTAGILSAIRDSGDGYKLLQTDAAVNHGSSGGPLVGADGSAVGVVSSIVRSDSAQGLNFAIPINYVRALLGTLHTPWTLTKMRDNLSNTKSTVAHDGDASLKDTLDWLKEQIPLSANHSLRPPLFSPELGNVDISERTIPIRFDACTISFDTVTVHTYAKSPDRPMSIVVRYTVPLGAITKATVIPNSFDAFDDMGKISKVNYWEVDFSAATRVLLKEEHDPDNSVTSDTRYDTDWVFYEESLANRVLKAIKHAADLCRTKEPF